MNAAMLPADQIGAITGIVGLVGALLTLIATWKMYTKANEKGWKVLVPIYGAYIGFKVASYTSGFWNIIITEVLVVIISAVSVSAGIEIVFLSCFIVGLIVLLIIRAKQCGRLAKVFGRSKGFAWLCFFLWPIAVMILGFNSNICYIGLEGEQKQTQDNLKPVDFGIVSDNKSVIQNDGREKTAESDALYGKSGKRYSAGKMIYSNYTAAVYELVGEPDHVLKVYSSEYLTGEREQEKKILAMISNPVAAENIAWPTDAVYSDGAFIGYCMNKVACLEDLTDPESLSERELIGKKRIVAAYNLCEVVKDVHRAGHVFGNMDPCDMWINTENCFVSLTGTDNYHIFDRDNGTVYRCCVMNPSFAAPEIMERAKNGIAVKDMPLSVFTRDTDYYALAVHIFRLLMKGYYPFDSHGTPKFPFADSYVTAPAGAHDYQSLPESVKALFRRAFCDQEFRPNPDEWQSALQEMLR